MARLTHVVRRVLRVGAEDGTVVKRLGGECVATEHVQDRRVGQLENQGYLYPIPEGVEPVEAVDGRWFIDSDTVARYGLQQQRPATTPGDGTELEAGSGSGGDEAQTTETGTEVDITPAAQRLAESNEIDIASLEPNDKGKITKAIVDAAIKAKEE